MVFTIININLAEQHRRCFCYTMSNLFTARARLTFSAPLKSHLSHWRKHSYHRLFPALLPLFFAFASVSLFIYIPLQSRLHIPLSVLHALAKWLHFLDLKSQRESIAWISFSSKPTQLKVLNLIKRMEWFCYVWNAGVYLLRYSRAYSVYSGVLRVRVINNPFSFLLYSSMLLWSAGNFTQAISSMTFKPYLVTF